MTTKFGSHRIAKWVGRLLAAVMISLVLFVTWNQANHNFGQVQPGRIYRSGQMPAGSLAHAMHDNRIKTVVNLRGSNSRRKWYVDELTRLWKRERHTSTSQCRHAFGCHVSNFERSSTRLTRPSTRSWSIAHGVQNARGWQRHLLSCSVPAVRWKTRVSNSQFGICSYPSAMER